MREVQYGDVIYVDRGYKHFGIYSGNGKVIHYTDHGRSSKVIQETSARVFMKGDDDVYVCNFNELGERIGSEGGKFPGAYVGGAVVGAAVAGPVGAIGGLALTKLYRMLRDSGSKLYSPEETVERARSRLDENEYSLGLNKNTLPFGAKPAFRNPNKSTNL